MYVKYVLRTRICMRPNWLKRITKQRPYNYGHTRVGAKMFIFLIQSFTKCFGSCEYCSRSDSDALHAVVATECLGIIILCSHVCSRVTLSQSLGNSITIITHLLTHEHEKSHEKKLNSVRFERLGMRPTAIY